ncbi:MAG: glycosyltransferase family 4 protein [Actinomycetia bacterium]|nr:glycosyltransferase family 4 protein [Actinomycetes bacterium]
MKILLVCHYFPPEIGAPQARLSETAKVWAEGHDVQVLTGFPNHPTGVVHEGYRGRRSMSEEVDGYSVERTWVYATPNEGLVKKTLGHLSFMLSGIVLGWRRLKRPDVVVVSSPTFFSILTAWVIAKRFRVPLVVEVRDLWPGIFVDLGVLTNKPIIWLLERLELAAYRAAALVVVVTEGFKDDLVSRGIASEKVEVITNGVDLERFSPGDPDSATRSALGAGKDEVLVAYIGAHGISHGLETLIDAAALGGPLTKFAFVGEGAAKQSLIEYAELNRATNVSFHPGVPREAVPVLLRSSDILIVPLRNLPLFSSFIPSKMFEFMATEVAVIGAVTGEPAAILSQAGAVVVPPEQPEVLGATIARLASNPTERAERAAEARRYVEKNYDRSQIALDYVQCLERLTDG